VYAVIDKRSTARAFCLPTVIEQEVIRPVQPLGNAPLA
jgi:hypothetical protein